MNNFRRRLSGEGIEYVFEADTTSISTTQSSQYGNVYITSTANGEYCGFEVLSYDGCVSLTSIYNWNSTGKRVGFNTTNSSVDPTIGHVILKQEGSNKIITITTSIDGTRIYLWFDAILIDGDNNSQGYAIITPLSAIQSIYGTNITVVSSPNWINVAFSQYTNNNNVGYYINILASSANYSNSIRTGDLIIRLGETREFTIKVVQLQSDYHYKSYVTIGNTNWGIKNIGSSSIESEGNYYQWGAGSATYQYGVNLYYTGGNTLPASADTATQVLGSGWRMPTWNEVNSLLNQSCYYTIYKGVLGFLVYDNTNAIFFPPGGELRNNTTHYNISNIKIWTNILRGPNGPSSYILQVVNKFDNATWYKVSYTCCYYGVQVRGVYN